ncbi:MAG: YchF/TatD family DNA exonuclease [Candidatus Omnitrophica bacterium]|nr:YchF/TatD family DNA exonuclease [Candidatus Omnitrophota bacterium]
MTLTDTHAHLDFEEFDNDRELTIKRSSEAGVSYIINVGADLESSRKSLELAKKYDNIFASSGLHPHEAQALTDQAKNEFERLVKEPKVVAVGEVGLDFHRNVSPQKDQETTLRFFISLARRCSKPLIIHTREAFPRMFDILNEEFLKGPLRGAFHCFSGSMRDLELAIKMGFYISVGGPVTYPKSEALRKIVGEIPDSRFLIETDSPYLAPQSHRGKRNEPSYLVEAAEEFARIRNVTIEDIARITTLNAGNLFGIPGADRSPRFIYKIRNSVYLNITNECTNNCTFCLRFTDPTVKGYNLKLDREPTADELVKGVLAESGKIDEVVFCGYGEPLIRFDVVKEVASALKAKGYRIRIDTNGHANLVHHRNILPELKGIVDAICVSLNAQDVVTYDELCRPKPKGNVYEAVKDFIREAKLWIPKVEATALDLPQVDRENTRRVAEGELGVRIRWRKYNEVG